MSACSLFMHHGSEFLWLPESGLIMCYRGYSRLEKLNLARVAAGGTYPRWAALPGDNP